MDISITINVPLVGRYLEKIKKARGTVVLSKTNVGNLGYMAQFKDPEGDLVCIWEDA